MIPGKRFTLGDGKDYVVPPLTFRQARESDESGLTAKLIGPDVIPQDRCLAGFALIHMALVRNYPDVPLGDMEGLLDPGLVEALIPLLLFGKVRPEERVTEGKPASQ